jgi:hypothetical protein
MPSASACRSSRSQQRRAQLCGHRRIARGNRWFPRVPLPCERGGEIGVSGAARGGPNSDGCCVVSLPAGEAGLRRRMRASLVTRLLPGGAFDASFGSPAGAGSVGPTPTVRLPCSALLTGPSSRRGTRTRRRPPRSAAARALHVVSSPPGTTLSSLMREKARTPTGRRFAGARFTEEPLVPRGPPPCGRRLGSCVSGAAAWDHGSTVLWVCVPPAGLSPAPAADVRDSRGVACNCKLPLT